MPARCSATGIGQRRYSAMRAMGSEYPNKHAKHLLKRCLGRFWTLRFERSLFLRLEHVKFTLSWNLISMSSCTCRARNCKTSFSFGTLIKMCFLHYFFIGCLIYIKSGYKSPLTTEIACCPPIIRGRYSGGGPYWYILSGPYEAFSPPLHFMSTVSKT